MIKDYFSNEFFLIALTFGSYFVGKLLRRRTGWVVMNPILVAIVVVIGFLEVTGVSYETYNAGGHMIEFWLRPAVVALGVPLYMQLEKIKKDHHAERAGGLRGGHHLGGVCCAEDGCLKRGYLVVGIEIGDHAYRHGGDEGGGRHTLAHSSGGGECRLAVCRVRV